MTFLSKSEKDTYDIGFSFAKALRRGDVVALFGAMGAGKTVFVKGLAAGLGVKGPVVSPTFNIALEYEGERVKFIHFDMYRVGSGDLMDVGFYEAVSGENIVAVEWSENIENEIEDGFYRVFIEMDGENEDFRHIKIIKGGETD